MKVKRINRLQNFWHVVMNKSILPNRNFILPIDIIIKSIKLLDVKGFFYFLHICTHKNFFSHYVTYIKTSQYDFFYKRLD